MNWLVLVACINVAANANVAYDKPVASWVVHTRQGPVKGYKALDGDFYVFYGIPYAAAPTGKNRYKAPLPPPVWREPLEAIDKGFICPQKDYTGVISKNKTMQEDCLIATIYVPDTYEKNIPVVVYVHGGGYLIGFGDYLTPRNFAKAKRVIIVTFNYRLGAHGFLCLGTEDVPGNAGLKDQVALLRWVKKNIDSFGGNPDDVTLAGYSAGAAAVDLLMLSKTTKGLFNKIIPESGVSLAAFNIQVDPLENAKRYATMLNFTDVDNFYALQEFYMTASYDVLNSVNVMNLLDSSLIFCPCVERDVGVERFLDDAPVNIITSGNYHKVPMLYGFATMEGLFRIPLFDVWKDQMNTKFSDFLPGDLQFVSDQEKERVAQKVKQFYFGEKSVSSESVLGYVDFFTDILESYSTLRSVKLHVEAGHDKIYLYEFVFTHRDSIKIPYTDIRGPDHCAQTSAVLDGLNVTHTNELLISNDLKEMKNITRELWFNFMITGNPSPTGSQFPAWPTTGANAAPHMALDLKLELRDYFERDLEKRYWFWDEIYKKHYRRPIPPPVPPSLNSTPYKVQSVLIVSILSLIILMA